MAEALKMQPEELQKLIGVNERPATGSTLAPVPIRRIPYFHEQIAAGPWVETRPREIPDGYLFEDLPADVFAIRIDGDSMEPDFRDGDVVIFQPYRSGEAGCELREGAAYYVEHSDGQATLKLLFIDHRRERYCLRAINRRKYPDPLYVPFQMVARIARAVASVRYY